MCSDPGLLPLPTARHPAASPGPRGVRRHAITIATHPLTLAALLLIANLVVFAGAWNLQGEIEERPITEQAAPAVLAAASVCRESTGAPL
jgi:hypothetical protein